MEQKKFAKAESLRSEYVIAVVGKVENREGNTNENMATGAIEVRATQLRILSESETPPFQDRGRFQDQGRASSEIPLSGSEKTLTYRLRS